MSNHRKRKRQRKRRASHWDQWDDINNAALDEVQQMGKIDLPSGIAGHNNSTKKKDKAVTEGYQGWQGNYQYSSCAHKGDKLIYSYSDGDKSLYAASSHGLDPQCGQWGLIIDLAHVVKVPGARKFVESLGKWTGLNKFMYQQKAPASEHLILDWPDMNPPPVTLDFWLSLWEMLPTKSVICCFGGHGRTGTCLASLMIADGVDYYSAVSHVRSEHCKKAIETVGQELYLHAIYCEYLRRAIVLAEQAKETGNLNDLTADLQYALKHVPNNFSSYGEERPTKSPEKVKYGQQTQQIVAGMPVPPASVPVSPIKKHDPELHDEYLRKVGGKEYLKCCVDPKCDDRACTRDDHMGWVEFGASPLAGFHLG